MLIFPVLGGLEVAHKFRDVHAIFETGRTQVGAGNREHLRHVTAIPRRCVADVLARCVIQGPHLEPASGLHGVACARGDEM